MNTETELTHSQNARPSLNFTFCPVHDSKHLYHKLVKAYISYRVFEGIEGHWAFTKIEEKEIFQVSCDSLDMVKRQQKEPYTLFWGYPVYILVSHHWRHLRACVLNQCKQLTAVSSFREIFQFRRIFVLSWCLFLQDFALLPFANHLEFS